ncbi:MAG: OmpA family protein [Betaproteobacteria bacterium]|nr:OmpA family protein [Betaproteobacteria bacterium]
MRTPTGQVAFLVKKIFSKKGPLAALMRVIRMTRRRLMRDASEPAPATDNPEAARRTRSAPPSATSIHFAVGSAVVRREYVRLLARVAEYFVQSTYRSIALEAHAGEKEGSSSPHALALRRARAVKNWLRRFGVDPEDISISDESSSHHGQPDSGSRRTSQQRKVIVRFLPDAIRTRQRAPARHASREREPSTAGDASGADPT